MASSSSYSITNVGVACSAKWNTALSFTVSSGRIQGEAVAKIDGQPRCVYPSPIPTATMLRTALEGTATNTDIRLRFGANTTYEPMGAPDVSGMWASFFGITGLQPTIRIPITSPGRAQGEQSLRFESGVNIYQSTNAVELAYQKK
jgi:hypothetical protein